MAKLYKEMRVCTMCKKRFEFKKAEKGGYSSRYYCPDCSEKYFKNKKEG